MLPAKATEGAGAMLLLRPQCCTVAAAVVSAVVSHERFRTITTTTAAVLLLRTPIGTVAVVTTAVLRRGPRDITDGAAVTAGWKLQYISSGVMTPFRAAKNGGKRTTEICFILVVPVLSRKGDAVFSDACLLYRSVAAAIRGWRRP